ncbi:MAG: class I SAM-dependent methyltransferase [Ignavibacteria bacterium]|jgi:SAM-dependent methyltransferase
MNKKLLCDIASYYSDKIKKFGNVPKGVDWKDEESQLIRLKKLMEVINFNIHFSVNDLGCGYGKLFELINSVCNDFEYKGFDLSEDMISVAMETYGTAENKSFNLINSPIEISPSDYTLASGIFNVKMNYNDDEWKNYILETLKYMNEKSENGFSFNLLSNYCNEEHMRDDLFYADPCFFFDFCKRNFSRNVSLLHDYNLYEFSILIKK